MATYNCEKTVGLAIDSILQQSYQNMEFVICDDCSTDSTFCTLEKYKNEHPNKIVLLRNDKNSKLPFSLNKCLEHVTGEYIARMDADDVSTENRLETQVQFLDTHPEYAVCGTDMVRFDENGDYGYYRSVDHPNKNTLMHEVPFCHATIMMRKEAYDALDGYTVSDRTVRGQDVDLWFRFYANGYQGDNIHLPLYRVREDKDFVKRGSLRGAWNVTKTRMIGFKLLGYPVSKYYLIPLPVFSHFVPRKLKLIRRSKMERSRMVEPSNTEMEK